MEYNKTNGGHLKKGEEEEVVRHLFWAAAGLLVQEKEKGKAVSQTKSGGRLIL